MNEKRIAKARRDFDRQTKARRWLMLLGAIQFAAAVMFGRLFYRTGLRMLQLPVAYPDGGEGLFRMQAMTTLIVVCAGIATAVMGVASVHYFVEGLIENPRDILLSHLLRKEEEKKSGGERR